MRGLKQTFDFGALLKAKIVPTGIILFGGCGTAFGEDNLASRVSQLFPDALVMGQEHSTVGLTRPPILDGRRRGDFVLNLYPRFYFDGKPRLSLWKFIPQSRVLLPTLW